MARPTAKELTERELELMHIYWQHPEMNAAKARDLLAEAGRDLAYTTVATLSRLLCEKGYLVQTNAERPFLYKPAQEFQKVSGRLVSDLVKRVFLGSRTQMLLTLVEDRPLSSKERQALLNILKGKEDRP
jgi:BlaI family transcriptional regulator, penicillinase repressor